MRRVNAMLLSVTVLLIGLTQGLGFESTVPAFLWSSHPHESSHIKVVDYQTISTVDLAKSVLSEGGWSNVVCSGENNDKDIDVAVVFIGRKLQSSDISNTKQQDSSLVDMLKLSFTSSNFSMAFPYVAIPDDNERLENSLISTFEQNCGRGLGVNRIAYFESCSVERKNIEKLQGLHSVQAFVDSRNIGTTDLIVVCGDASEEPHHTDKEGEILSDLVNLFKQSGSTYTILYSSHPLKSIQYHVPSTLRFLAESTQTNFSANLTSCDGVCQIKTSLLEGLFVAIVLLIILISGLCCMMGIDTPTRFETPQES